MKVISAIIAVAITGAFLFMVFRLIGTFFKEKDKDKPGDKK
jgi:hypothetical protein